MLNLEARSLMSTKIFTHSHISSPQNTYYKGRNNSFTVDKTGRYYVNQRSTLTPPTLEQMAICASC